MPAADEPLELTTGRALALRADREGLLSRVRKRASSAAAHEGVAAGAGLSSPRMAR